MVTRKELQVIILSAFFTIALLGIAHKFWKTHDFDHNAVYLPKYAFTQTTTGVGIGQGLPPRPAPQHKVPVSVQRSSDVKSITVEKELSNDHQNVLGRIDLMPSAACPASVESAYATASGDFEDKLSWCKSSLTKYNVRIGHSWGSLGKDGKMRWDSYKCNELINVGKLQSCAQRWGWDFPSDWIGSAVAVVRGVSNVTCARDVKSSVFCQYRDVMLDFNKMHTPPKSSSRSFSEGFLTVYGVMENYGAVPRIPGYLVRDVEVTHESHKDQVQKGLNQMHAECDLIEKRPTFVLSNDDIFNLGHYYNDVMGVWGMLVLAGVSSQDSVLLNMDGLRSGGPAGVGSHRIMVPGSPDEHGPYIGYFQSWFQEVQKSKDFEHKKVCYKELYLPPMPGVPWFWNDWSQDNDCSRQAASPLYQSYNLFMRHFWRAKYGEKSLPNPPTDVVHVVVEVRAINPKKKNNHSSARHISNLEFLINEIQKIPGVKVTAQDFAKIPFEEQVALSHSAGVFVSMHGAGTTHIFHSALGQPNCCALIELFPDTTVELHAARGYGNLARMLGLHHWRNVAGTGKTRPTGTEVDIPAITQLVRQAVEAVRTRPTCLHNVKDSSGPIQYKNLNTFSHWGVP